MRTMACPLPSVTGQAQMGGPGPWDGGVLQDLAKGHPFDRPYSVMKALQAELAELRSLAQQESRRREAEAARLQAELAELRNGLAEERAKRTSNVDGVERSLGLELAALQKALQEARLEASDSLKAQRKITVGDFDAVRAQLAQLTAGLDGERRERLALAKDFSARVGASTASHDNLAAKLTQDLDDHLRQISELQELGKSHREEICELQVKSAEACKAVETVQHTTVVSCDDLVRPLAARLEAMDKSIEDFRASSAEAMRRHWKTTTTDVAELRARLERQSSALAGELASERKEREQAVEGLQPKIQANELASKTALVRVENLTSGHFGNPRTKHCAVCLEDRGGSPGRLAPRPPPEPRGRRMEGMWGRTA